jgi:glycosyltransferase involved in cell wall biosynthesis
MTEPRIQVSILLPTNSKTFLKSALQSIAEQQFDLGCVELVLVLDRIEMDANDEVIPEVLTKNLVIITSKKPGIVEALNSGLQACSGEFVARMDQDDLMYPMRLAKQTRYLENKQKILAVGGQFNHMNVDGKRLGISHNPNRSKKVRKALRYRNVVAHPTVMFRKESVIDVGGYRNYFPEDWDLWVRLSEVGEVANIRDVVLDYRIHESQLSRQAMYNQNTASKLIRLSFYLRSQGERDFPLDGETVEMWMSRWLRDSPQAKAYVASKEYSELEHFLVRLWNWKDALRNPRKIMELVSGRTRKGE